MDVLHISINEAIGTEGMAESKVDLFVVLVRPIRPASMYNGSFFLKFNRVEGYLRCKHQTRGYII